MRLVCHKPLSFWLFKGLAGGRSGLAWTQPRKIFRTGGAGSGVFRGPSIPCECVCQGEFFMALPRNYRFPVEFADAFPAGVLALSEVQAAPERQSQQDRQRGRVPRQRVDEETRLPVWQVTVSDPAPARAREAAVTVEILSADEPVLPEPVAGMAMAVREVEFVGLTAEPRLGGQGEFRFITFVYRAEGVRGRRSDSGSGSKSSGRSGSSGSQASGSSSGGE